MWVIVSSWRLRGYCRRKWPSLIQVALSIPLPDPRLALPRRSLALRPLFLSFSLSPRCPPPRPPPPLLLCLLPRISHFALLFPLSSTTPDMLRCFRLPLSCTRNISYPSADPSSPCGREAEAGNISLRYFILFFLSSSRSSSSSIIRIRVFPDESFVWEKKEGDGMEWKGWMEILFCPPPSRSRFFGRSEAGQGGKNAQHFDLDGWI